MAHGMFVWNELATDDVEAAKRFFAETLGWSYHAMGMPGGGTYWIAQAEGKEVAGLFDKRQIGLGSAPAHWLAYVDVDDIDARLKLAETNGAKIHRPAFDIPGVGRIGILADPTGAALGFITPVPRPTA